MIRPHRLTDGLVVVAVVILVRKEVAMTAANRGGSRGLGVQTPKCLVSIHNFFRVDLISKANRRSRRIPMYKRCGLQPADPFRLVIPGWRYWDLWPTATILSDVCRINWLNWIKKKHVYFNTCLRSRSWTRVIWSFIVGCTVAITPATTQIFIVRIGNRSNIKTVLIVPKEHGF